MKVFVNLPVKDLDRSKEFFSHLGFSFNEKFTDENAACMVLSDDGYVMLLVEKFFRTFTPKEICDTGQTTEAIIALSAASREQVDEMYGRAIAAGGAMYAEPQDHGFMYLQRFQDLDGHLWEIFYMDESALDQNNHHE